MDMTLSIIKSEYIKDEVNGGFQIKTEKSEEKKRTMSAGELIQQLLLVPSETPVMDHNAWICGTEIIQANKTKGVPANGGVPEKHVRLLRAF